LSASSPRGVARVRAINIDDLREAARRRLPRAIYDFLEGGAEDEVTLRENRSQFNRWRLVARHPVDVSSRDQGIDIFGRYYTAPFVISPTGLAGLMRGRAEAALATAAALYGIPITLSSATTVTIEDATAEAGVPPWFQLYILKDRGLSELMIDRARAAGCGALVISIDCPVVGQRERDLRNRLSVPLRPSWANMTDLVRRLPWLIDILRHGAPGPRMLARPGERDAQMLTARMIEQLDPSVSWRDIDWVRQRWGGPLIIKGLVSPVDVARSIDHGMDGIVVSNQGGRQLDHAVPTIEALPQAIEAADGRCTIFCDGGFRRGSDVAKALALGARAKSVGRATLYGVTADGFAGAIRALTILGEELDRVMGFLGCTTVDQLDRTHLWDMCTNMPGPGQA